MQRISTHTLTWSVTHTFHFVFVLNFYFNSHAHVERDYKFLQVLTTFYISTHTLTWSVTISVDVKIVNNFISTHTLTWSVTFKTLGAKRYAYISTHTLTWSVTSPLNC